MFDPLYRHNDSTHVFLSRADMVAVWIRKKAVFAPFWGVSRRLGTIAYWVLQPPIGPFLQKSSLIKQYKVRII